ncbi:MAG TPA: ribonuclease HII, partial [Anaerolineae bacterium]
QHKGYGTAAHRAALETRGASPEHRASFAPIKNLAKAEGPA